MTKAMGVAAAALLAISAAVASPARAQSADRSITIDEELTGTISGPGLPPTYLDGTGGFDPGPFGGFTIYYYLPSGLSPRTGDVYLLENPGDRSTISDVIRFYGAGVWGPLGQIWFYSDRADGFDDQADAAPLPPEGSVFDGLELNEVPLPGIGAGATYTPTPLDPGYVPGYNVTYTFISDYEGVPESATWTMMLLGYAGMGLLIRSRRGKPSEVHVRGSTLLN
jgi:hypothetical protein